VSSFLFAFFVAGFLWGFFDNFFFWLMEDLGSTKFLMGMSLSVGTIAGIPITLFSGKHLGLLVCIHKMSEELLTIIGCGCPVVRVILTFKLALLKNDVR
jgi:MFS_1 like family